MRSASKPHKMERMKMSPFDWIVLALACFIYGAILGGFIIYAQARDEQANHLAHSNRQLHHDLKLQRITQDNERYIRHRDKTTR